MFSRDMALAVDPRAFFRAATGVDPDPWQVDVLTTPSRRVLLNCCRQSGKSTTTAVIALRAALFDPGSLTLLVAPSLRQSSELFAKLIDFYRRLGEPVPPRSTTASALTLTSGSRVIALPGESDATIRGYSSVGLLVVDEAARVSDAVLYGLRPVLAVSQGTLICLSTPFGRRGAFYESWEGPEDWHRVRVTWRDVPRFDRGFIEEERRVMPRLFFASEYETEFVDQVDQVFASEDIDRSLVDHVEPLVWQFED